MVDALCIWFFFRFGGLCEKPNLLEFSVFYWSTSVVGAPFSLMRATWYIACRGDYI